ncbi:hypothetical protein NKI61_19780 [Mesorhizobium sp. M0514]|uniref:hypothetical protein n=1 Tax=Mesorhizobium sp. M0514 TaxID=2956955 RepID=UPI00333765FB
MDAFLKALCIKHDLTTVSVALYTEVKTVPFTVYLHWGERQCVGGNGNTVDEALACALYQMGETRAPRAA